MTYLVFYLYLLGAIGFFMSVKDEGSSRSDLFADLLFSAMWPVTELWALYYLFVYALTKVMNAVRGGIKK